MADLTYRQLYSAVTCGKPMQEIDHHPYNEEEDLAELMGDLNIKTNNTESILNKRVGENIPCKNVLNINKSCINGYVCLYIQFIDLDDQEYYAKIPLHRGCENHYPIITFHSFILPSFKEFMDTNSENVSDFISMIYKCMNKGSNIEDWKSYIYYILEEYDSDRIAFKKCFPDHGDKEVDKRFIVKMFE